MDSTAVLKLFRSQLMDTAGPHYLWTDDEVYSYMDEAQNQLCRHIRGIDDAVTPALTRVKIKAGQPFSQLDPRVLEVRTVMLASTSRPLGPIGTNEFDTYRGSQNGIPGGYVLGMSKNAIRWDCVPVVDDLARLTVYRLPMEPITGPSQELEVDDQYKYALLAHMVHLAYLKPDPDTYDKPRSDAAQARFEDYCAAARRDVNKIRSARKAVSFGGYW